MMRVLTPFLGYAFALPIGTAAGERIVDHDTCDRTAGRSARVTHGEVPHADRACTREPSERVVAGQRGSMLQAAEGLLLRIKSGRSK